MGHSLFDVLSVWWIKVVIDISVVTAFVLIVRRTTKKENE